MRTIKFRGKSRYDRRWIIGALVPNGKRPCIAEFGKLFELTEVDHESVGQFTGLSDHNGREIYDGDIITVKGDYPRVVLWDKMSWALMPTEYYHEEDFWVMNLQHPGLDWWDEFADEFEIIGNIYENPDMLRGGKDGNQ